MHDKALKEIYLKYPDGVIPMFQNVVERLGFETMCIISSEFGGTTLYIPTKKRLFSGCIVNAVKKEFDGTNLKKLAVKYEFCERTIRNITDFDKYI